LDVSLRAFDLTADGFFIRSGAVCASVFSRGGEKDIRKIATFAVLFIAVTAFSAPVMAVKKCSVGAAAVEKAGGYANAVKAAVKDASSCKRAYKTFAACQLGSSADNALADIVQSKCEPLFMGKASSSTKKAYKKAQDRCNKIAEKNEGTMYQGLAAVCQAGAARDFAHKYSGKCSRSRSRQPSDKNPRVR
jgi:hypothetical protein